MPACVDGAVLRERVQREKSFRDEIDAAKRVRHGTGLKKAQDFQLELTRGKRAQGKTYTDPKLAEESFMDCAEAVHPHVRAAQGQRADAQGLPRPVARGHRHGVRGQDARADGDPGGS